MEININFNPYEVFSCDMSEPFAFITSVCENLSQTSICESMGIDPLTISPSEKEELINYISTEDYILWLTFETENPSLIRNGIHSNGFRINAQSGTEGDYFFRSAVIFELMGMTDLCYAMRMEFYARIANDMCQDRIGEAIEKDVISHVNRVRASKPRHQCYEEVMGVITATWEKYPNASQTGIHEALCSHYYGKVSRNALSKWISSSGLRPPKPEKYSSFELVFPH